MEQRGGGRDWEPGRLGSISGSEKGSGIQWLEVERWKSRDSGFCGLWEGRGAWWLQHGMAEARTPEFCFLLREGTGVWWLEEVGTPGFQFCITYIQFLGRLQAV